jgi:hypothetical protein
MMTRRSCTTRKIHSPRDYPAANVPPFLFRNPTMPPVQSVQIFKLATNIESARRERPRGFE